MDKAVNKKEYLKKYLSGDDKKRRKKKIAASTTLKSKIIDDDIDLKKMKPLDGNELEIYDLAEDAPQVAGIIDDRPEEVRIMSEYRETKKWKIVTREYEDVKVSAVGDSDPEIDRSGTKKLGRRENADSDESPPRKERTDRDKKSMRRAPSDSDASPPRKGKVRAQSAGSDQSPPRKRVRETSKHGKEGRTSQKVGGEFEDRSPPRRHSKAMKDGLKVESELNRKPKSHKEDGDSDVEPPRKHSRHADRHSRRHFRHKGRSGSDSEEEVNVRTQVKEESFSSDEESPRRHSKGSRNRESDRSQHKQHDRRKSVKRESDDESQRTHSKAHGKHESSRMTKTLDGKKAGLQDASSMREEVAELKRRQAESLARLGDDLSGRGAVAIQRDKKTGKKRDLKEEARLRREKEAKAAEIAEKYAVWGKGLKQVDDKAAKMQDDLHEMSKPVARYINDEDLEEMRKNEEKEGDPMLEYIRNKRKKEGVVVPSGKPKYQGSYLPNRYGIRPGHRWDGVDRSSGYERKWFEEKNAKKARDEEAFKWSTEDM